MFVRQFCIVIKSKDPIAFDPIFFTTVKTTAINSKNPRTRLLPGLSLNSLPLISRVILGKLLYLS